MSQSENSPKYSSTKMWYIYTYTVEHYLAIKRNEVLIHAAASMTTGKTIALTRRTFVGKVIYLLFNMLSRLVIVFLPRSKRLLISWLQSPSAVILEPPKIIYNYTQKHNNVKNWLPLMNNEFRHFPKGKWLRLFSFNYVRVIKDQMSIFFNC